MKNFLQTGEVLAVAAPQNLKSGDVVVVGALAGVAVEDALSGTQVAIAAEGVFAIAKTSGAVFAAGDKVGWNATTSKAVVSSTFSTPLVGVAVAAAASGDATVKVAINQPAVVVTASS